LSIFFDEHALQHPLWSIAGVVIDAIRMRRLVMEEVDVFQDTSTAFFTCPEFLRCASISSGAPRRTAGSWSSGWQHAWWLIFWHKAGIRLPVPESSTRHQTPQTRTQCGLWWTVMEPFLVLLSVSIGLLRSMPWTWTEILMFGATSLVRLRE